MWNRQNVLVGLNVNLSYPPMDGAHNAVRRQKLMLMSINHKRKDNDINVQPIAAKVYPFLILICYQSKFIVFPKIEILIICHFLVNANLPTLKERYAVNGMDIDKNIISQQFESWNEFLDQITVTVFVLFSLFAYAQVQFKKYVFIYKYGTSQKCHKPLK